jgi:hypothetical protein
MDARRLGSMIELLLAINGEVTKYGQGPQYTIASQQPEVAGRFLPKPTNEAGCESIRNGRSRASDSHRAIAGDS